jgi:hypothetical protein
VLDLWGLGSHEALLARSLDPSGRWMVDSLTKHNVHYAIIYTRWLPHSAEFWLRVAQLKLLGRRAAAAQSEVDFYATDHASAAALQSALQAYQGSSPLAAAVLQLGTATSDDPSAGR